MARKTTSSKTKGTEFSFSAERAAELMAYAGRSGKALKVSTVRNNGNYPIRVENKGTSILTRAVFSLAGGKPGQAISASAFVGALDKLLADAATLRTVQFPPKYNNLKTVVSRLRSEVRKGAIRAFTAQNVTAADLKVFGN